MPGKLVQRNLNEFKQELYVNVSKIFDQAQDRVTNHQKNIVALHKIFVEAVQLRRTAPSGRIELTGEIAFESAFRLLISRALLSKKGAGPGDRIVRFVSDFVRYINNRAPDDPIDDDDVDSEGWRYTPAARFTERLVLKNLLAGFDAKDKLVRYRVIQICSEIVCNLGEVEDTIYYILRGKCLERLNDKEISVRVQAGIALCKFCGIDDPEELEEKGLTPLWEVLFDSMAYDTQSEVRRAITLNIPLTKSSISPVLERTRDTDENLRKLLYGLKLERSITIEEGGDRKMGPAHPRTLTISQRELIVRNGLGDRKDIVRAAAATLIAKWVDAAGETYVKPEEEEEEGTNAKRDVSQNVIEFLGLFDLGNGTIAAEALVSVFQTRPDIFKGLEFGDKYWTELTSESAFLARVFVDYCLDIKDISRTDAMLPVVTEMAFRIQEMFNKLTAELRANAEDSFFTELDDETRALREDAVAEKEFVLCELLKLALKMDYTDEIGRRKMYSLARDMLSHDELPDDLVPHCLELLRDLSNSEEDLIRVVNLDVIQTLLDPGDEEEPKDVDPDASFESGTPATVKAKKTTKPREEMTDAERARSDAITMRCLAICEGMLERVNKYLKDRSTLSAIIRELIYPAVQSKDPEFRERGLRCLGLVGLISGVEARQSMSFFLKRVDEPEEELKLVALRVIFDMLMVHEQEIMVPPHSPAFLVDFFAQRLAKELAPRTQALLCIGVSKLIFMGVLVHKDLLRWLITYYFSHTTIHNQELRQCLHFFFHEYTSSSLRNQRILLELFREAFYNHCTTRASLDEDEEMVTAAQMGGIYVSDWTNPDNIENLPDELADDPIRLDMGIEIMEELLVKDSAYSKDDKKALCQLLSKLEFPDKVDEDKIHRFKVYLDKVRLCRPPRDAPSRNALTKFATYFEKKFEKQLEGFSEEDFRQLEMNKDLFELLDDIIPLDDDEDVLGAVDRSRTGRKRRSESVVSSATEDDGAPRARKGRSKGKPKRPRLSRSSDEESDYGDDHTEVGTPPPRSAAPTRTLPKRSAALKAPAVIVISSDSEEEEVTPRNNRSRPSATKVKTEPDEVDDSDQGPSSVGQDSLFDDDSEEEEEVSVLLNED